MHLCFIDFETYWDEHHSLSKMSAIEYALSPKTELQLLSVKVDHYPTDVFVGEDEIKKIGSHKDFWRDKFVIAHNNSGFDAMLAAWRLGIRPAMWGCTLAMARPLYAKTVGLSLAKQVAHHGLGVKDSRALTQTRGKRLADFTRDELDAMIRYNRDGDTEQCAALFHVLRRHYTFEELWHIDCNIRMLVEPGFELDVPMLETALSIERTRKHKSLLDLAHLLRPEGLDWADEPAVAAWVNEQMQSSAKFSAILESRGVEVPMKWSKTSPDKEIPAIAKTDEAMEELLDHDDEVVAAAAAARLSAKSTQLETRIQSFLSTYKAVGKLPVPAHYCGADTTGRDSGWLYNMLNLPRVNPDKPKVSDALRNSVKAPKGRVVLVRDLSGIELRVNHTLWKVQRSMDNWKRKPDYDLYRDTAASMYSITPDEVQKPQRHYAKIIELACGYQQGGKTFRSTARVQGGLRLTLEQANHGVQFWRGRYPEIAGRDGGWATCHDALNYIARGDKVAIDPWGLCTTEKDAIVLPSGRRILYPNLRQQWVDKWDTVDGQRVKTKDLTWVYDDGRKLIYIYGGKVDENCLAGSSRVLTHSGWKRLDEVGPEDQVHDGVEFVRHGGLVCKSIQSTVAVDGVFMTPDHEVLTDEGWAPALDQPRPWRPDLRGVDCPSPRAERRPEDALAVPMHVRDSVREGGGGCDQGSEAGRDAELRVPVGLPRAQGERHPRHVEAPGVRSVGLHEGPLRAPDPRGVAELWGSRHHGLRRVAELIRRVLGGHGPDVRARPNAGPDRQQPGVFPEQLPVGGLESAGAQPAGSAAGGHPGPVGGDGHTAVDALLPAPAGASAHVVYDLLNCGPRHRFVVMGDNGPFVVHNCVQALARDIIFGQALAVFKRTGFRPKHKVYDELVYLPTPAQAPDLMEIVGEEMRKPPSWWPELTLWSEGDTAPTYGAAK